MPVEILAADGAGMISRLTLSFLRKPRSEDVTIFTRDLALLLRAGARLDEALDLLANDVDLGRLRQVVGKIRASVLAGESFADATAAHPSLFRRSMWRSFGSVSIGDLGPHIRASRDERTRLKSCDASSATP